MKRDEPSVIAKSSNRSLKALLSAAAAVAFFLANNVLALSAHAEFSGTATMPNGAQVPFTNVAATNWVNGELVLKFTNTTLTTGFELKGYATASYLVVGGGGAGGSGKEGAKRAETTGKGTGGGGGAGGFLSQDNVILANGIYSVTVGKGGLPAADASGQPGGDGDDSVLACGGADVARAYGGGGGGADCEGSGTIVGTKNIGSGGGGSAAYSSGTVPKAGGQGTDGQGKNGGEGKVGRTAGGGGGAGGDGEAGSSSNAGAKGGAGATSKIWDGKTDEVYAAGGGSGSQTGTSGAGGSGIGGNGGGGTSGTGTLATAGKAGTGSGGGGGSLLKAGAAGGSGVVIVRIAAALGGPLVKPESQTLVYDGEKHLLVEKSLATTVWQQDTQVDRVEGQNAGEYKATVKLVEGFKWLDDTVDDVDVKLTIEKAQVEITDLHIDSWTEQPAGATLPEPTCTVNVKGANPVYTYGKDPSGADATSTKPTKAGSYYVFATVTDALNWTGDSASAPFTISEQPGTLFTDSVEIVFDPYEPQAGDPQELTNFPYRIELSTSSPPGFDYARAGATGENICFADAAGNIYGHFVESWDPTGTSVVYVRVPRLDATARTIKLYWKTADGKTAPPYDPSQVFSDWDKDEADAFGRKPKTDFGFVVIDGKKLDAWVVKPRIDRTSWSVGGEVGHIVTNGWLKSGREIAFVIYDATTGQPLTPQAMPTAEGVYYLLFSAKNPTGDYIEPAPERIDIRVLDSAPYYDLSDGQATQTLGGRVLTANGDDGITPKLGAEEGQGYWQVRSIKSGARTLTFNPYWTHDDDRTDKNPDYPYLRAGTTHKLHYIESAAKTNVYWRMTEVRFGNTFGTKLDMPQERCFLPWSATGYGTSVYGNRTKTNLENEVGQLVMMNMRNASICSPCYTNGIGTIYFDTVNASPYDAGKDFMHFVLEVATKTTEDLLPTDENAGEELEKLVWETIPMTPLRCTDGVFTPEAPTDDFVPSVTKGGTDRNFYRIYAKLNRTGTIRFRLRRTGQSNDGVGADWGHYILVDNILVSFPMGDAKAVPVGVCHPEKTGKQALGWEGAMANVAFPSVADIADGGVFARAEPQVAPASGAPGDPSTFIQLSKFHYQWRYLNQHSNGWHSVDLQPGRDFVAETPLELREEAGDIEFWLETYTKIPFYAYTDYTGAGLKLGGLYTEEVGMKYYPENALEGGRETVRIRSGRSEWNGIRVILEGAGFAFGADEAMELITDHTWRALVKVPTNVIGDVNFYFEGGQRWPAGAKAPDPAYTGRQWAPVEAVTNRLPARGETKVGGKPKPFRADGATNYMEFQFDDETGLFTVGHAEYQDFNRWHDAKTPYFRGTWAETSGVSVASMVETNTQMLAWKPLDIDNDNWNESFYLTDYGDAGYPKNVTFPTHKLPHRWVGDNGMFVDADLTGTSADNRKKNAGIAWKMQGFGLGSVSYTDSNVPGGLDTITFRARLEQTPTFDDFSYCYADGMMATNDYTFLVPAILSCNSSKGLIDNFAPGASMSLVGFYTPMKGCYEFRVSRDDNANLRFAIYKWYRKGYVMTSERIATHLYKDATFWSTSGTAKPNMYGMFISVGEDEAGKTSIIGGLTTAAFAPSSAYVGKTSSSPYYRAIRAVDGSLERHTGGTAGVLMSSCDGRFLTVRRYSQHLPASTISSTRKDPDTADKEPGSMMTDWYTTSTQIAAFPGTRDQNADLKAMQQFWAYAPGRIESYEASDYKYTPTAIGFRPPANLGQTVDVYLKSSRSSSGDDAAWTYFDSRTVTSYGWKDFTMTIQTNQSCHVKLVAGNAPADVTIGALPSGNSTVGGIKQTGWNGADMENPPDDDFIYTQARVTTNLISKTTAVDPDGQTNKTVVTTNLISKTTAVDPDGQTNVTVTVTNRYCVLQPARTDATKALSIRSPILYHGVGMIDIKYTNVCEGAEIWVQMCTNNVVGDLRGTGGLNGSIEEGTGRRQWETIAKYTYADLGKFGEKQHFVGLHDRLGHPVVGVLRVFVPTNVIAAAAGQSLNNPDYGSVTITDVLVRDEPALDVFSWLGWNLRVLGDPLDSERRMYLPDAGATAGGASGLSSALNDSAEKDLEPGVDPSLYSHVNPTIQSPTFKAGSIGYVRFKARVYDDSGVVGEPATVTLYGADLDGASEDQWGTAITNFTVDALRFREYEYRAPQNQRFAAIRLAVDDVIESADGAAKPVKVLLDEVIVSEKTESTVGFAYARPFRSQLDRDVALAEAVVKGANEQPLCGESWGVQAQLKVDQFDKDVDLARGFKVKLRYFVGATPWGYESWKGLKEASKAAELKLVDEANLVYRSTVTDPATVVKPTVTPNTIVQFMLTVEYWLKNDPNTYELPIAVTETEGSGWTNPSWYEPIDRNIGKTDPVPYTILDGMSPGRAWINEVNFNDGTKEENGQVKVVTNQFIEVAVPWGVDLKDWYLKLTDYNLKSITLAKFGYNGVPAVKTSGEHNGDYGFVVLESPGTKKAGGIHDADGKAVADAQWTSETLSDATLPGGEMQFSQPYQLELYRPSGILEHQFVIAGTNEWRTKNPAYWPTLGVKYEGTNLLSVLDVAHPSVRRFFAGEDVSRKPSAPSAFASLGVTGGGHGEAGAWSSDMKFTPGHVNEGQEELSGWYLRPNGGSVWIYALVDAASRGNVKQRFGEPGEATGEWPQDTLAVVSSGSSTNVVYDVSPWYAADVVAVTDDGRTNYSALVTGTGTKFQLNNVTETVHVVAREMMDPALVRAGLDPNDAYTPAVMRWMRDGSLNGTFKNPNGPITNAIYRGLHADATNVLMSLKGMYWFDIDPTDPGWWLRGGTVDLGLVNRMRKFNPSSKTPYQNPQIGVKLYLSNDVSQVVYAPRRLQGLNNEKSDDPSTYTSWTSVTFKVEAKLENGMEHNVGYLPFRWFAFGPDSFVKPEDAASVGRPAYTTKIEILDPFSLESPGYSYGWRDYRGNAIMLRWNVTEALRPSGVELLKADSTYDGSPLFE